MATSTSINNELPKNTEVYLDSNFLTAYFVPHHSHHKGSVKLFAILLVQTNILNLSPLVVDEVLHAVRNEYNYLRGKKKLKPETHSFFYQQLKLVVNQLISFHTIKIRQFEKKVEVGCSNAVDNIKKFSLAPKDAFSIAYIQDWDINYIVTNDSNFDSLKEEGINKVSY